MHLETGNYIHHALDIVSNYWGFILFAIGAIWGGLLWAWSQYVKVFARNSDLEAYAMLNTQQHDDIKKEVRGLRQDMNDKVHEILEILIKQGQK